MTCERIDQTVEGAEGQGLTGRAAALEYNEIRLARELCLELAQQRRLAATRGPDDVHASRLARKHLAKAGVELLELDLALNQIASNQCPWCSRRRDGQASAAGTPGEQLGDARPLTWHAAQ